MTRRDAAYLGPDGRGTSRQTSLRRIEKPMTDKQWRRERAKYSEGRDAEKKTTRKKSNRLRLRRPAKTAQKKIDLSERERESVGSRFLGEFSRRVDFLGGGGGRANETGARRLIEMIPGEPAQKRSENRAPNPRGAEQKHAVDKLKRLRLGVRGPLSHVAEAALRKPAQRT